MLFLAQENNNPLSKYTIALASCGVIHANGSLDLLFLLLKLCSLKIYIFVFIFIRRIYTQDSELL